MVLLSKGKIFYNLSCEMFLYKIIDNKMGTTLLYKELNSYRCEVLSS